MKRRDFLKAASAGVASYSFGLPMVSHAADEYEGPLFIYLFALGGWDASFFCDPKVFGRSHWSGSVGTAGNLIYAPVARGGSDNFNQAFFEKYYTYTRVINGINTNSNAHAPCHRYFLNGVLGSDTYPSLMAAFAAAQAPNLPMSYIAASQLKFTGNLVPYTPLSSPDLLSTIANPNVDGSRTFMQDSILNAVRDAQSSRLDRLQAIEQQIPRQKRTLDEFVNARTNSANLDRLATLIPDGGFTTVDAVGQDSGVIPTLHAGLLSMKAGLCSAIGIEHDGYDTHAANYRQLDLLAELLYAVDFCWEEAARQGIDDRLCLVISSEFCRTPEWQGSDGTNHWPYGQFLAMTKPGGSVWPTIGNTRIGESDDNLQSRPLNFGTLQPDDDAGQALLPHHVHIALRRFLGIDSSSVLDNYGLDGDFVDLFG